MSWVTIICSMACGASFRFTLPLAEDAAGQ
jgi:hypothetical protein